MERVGAQWANSLSVRLVAIFTWVPPLWTPLISQLLVVVVRERTCATSTPPNAPPNTIRGAATPPNQLYSRHTSDTHQPKSHFGAEGPVSLSANRLVVLCSDLFWRGAWVKRVQCSAVRCKAVHALGTDAFLSESTGAR